MRNESNYIRSCLDSLVNQTFPPEQYEIIVADGRSTDNSRELVSLYEQRSVLVRLLDNQSRNTPSGMNVGIRAAGGRIIIIAGAHTIYPVDFVENCVLWLEKTGAEVVGGPVLTVSADESFGAKLVAAVLSSPFGVGNSKFRTSREEGFVDTVPFGAFRREVFDRVGMYNEKLVRNQDNDLNARIRKAGGKIYITPALTTQYHPVKTFGALLNYAFRTNLWTAFTLRENKGSMGLRHIVPAGFLIALLALLSASFVTVYARAFMLAILGLYLLTGLYFSARLSPKTSVAVSLALPFGAFCFHLAYGAGVLSGIGYLFREPSIKPIPAGLPVDRA